MEIELSRLSEQELPVAGELRLERDDSLDAAGIRFPDRLRFDGSARRSGEHYLLAGRIRGTIELDCGRCAEPFRHEVDITFEARYADQRLAPKPATSRAGAPEDEEDGIQLDEDDLDISFLPAGTDRLLVGDAVREQVLLEVPVRPLCRADCAGLCARCGANLNETECQCDAGADEGPTDLRLAALADWKKKLEGK